MSTDGANDVPLTEKQESFLKFLGIERKLIPAQLQQIEQAAVNTREYFNHYRKIKQDVPEDVIKQIDALTDEAEKLMKGKKPNLTKAIAKMTEADTKMRALANGHLQQYTLQHVTTAIERLERGAAPLRELVAKIDRDLGRVVLAAQSYPRLSSIEDPREKLAYSEKLAEQTEYWRSKIECSRAEAAKVGKTLDLLRYSTEFDAIARELTMLQKYQGQDIADLTKRLRAVKEAYTYDGKKLEGNTVKLLVNLREQDFNRSLQDLTSTQVRESSSDPSSAVAPRVFQKARVPLRVRGQGQQVRSDAEKVVQHLEQAGKAAGMTGSREKGELLGKQRELLDKIQTLQAIENANLDAASRRIMEASAVDSILLGMPDEDTLGVAAPGQTFDINSVVVAANIPPVLDDLSEDQVAALGTAVADPLRQLMQQLVAQNPDGDVLFDLGLKSLDDLKNMLAERLTINLKQANEATQRVIESLAAKLFETISQEFPNRPVGQSIEVEDGEGRRLAVPQRFTVGAQEYKDPKYLASGSFGHAIRYTLDGTPPDQPPEYVVLKQAVSDEAAGEMVNELKSHRHLQGNAGGQGHPNVLAQKGIVRDDQGQVFGITEFAGGGGLDQLGYAMGAAASVGVLGEQARHAMARNLFIQTVEGMCQLHDRRMVHRDLKPENVFMSADGTVKVADFGSSKSLDAQGQVNISSTDNRGNRTKDNAGVDDKFSAPENYDKSVDTISTKSDTFALGVLLTRLATPHQGQQQMYSGFVSDWTIRDQPKEAVTALDRLRQAMLEPDPEKRIDLKSVQYCMYVDEERSEEACSPEQLAALRKALMDYNEHVGRQIGFDQVLLLRYEGEIADLEHKKKSMVGDKIASTDREIKELRAKLADLRKKIDEVLKDEQCQPYVEALRKASDAIAGVGALPGRRSDGSETPEVGPATTSIDPRKVDLQKELDSIFRDLGVNPNDLERIVPNFGNELRALKCAMRMLRPGGQASRKAKIMKAIADNVTSLRATLQAALKPDESQTPAQAKRNRNDDVMKTLSKVELALNSFAGTVKVVAENQPPSRPDYSNVPFKAQYLEAMQALGLPPEKSNQQLIKALEQAEAAATPEDRNLALREAITQLDRNLTLLENYREQLAKTDSELRAKSMVKKDVTEAKARFQPYTEAGEAMKALFKLLKEPDATVGELVDLFSVIQMPEELEMKQGDEILRLLKETGDPENPNRDTARQEALKLVVAEAASLQAIFRRESTAVKTRIAENMKEYQRSFEVYRSERNLDYSAMATEFRKWKSQLKEAMA